MAGRDYRLATVLLEDNTVVYGYCPDRESVYVGDKVVVEDNETGKVLMTDYYISMEKIHQYVDETGLFLKRITEKICREKFNWGEDDE